jgi:hypothetical protein
MKPMINIEVNKASLAAEEKLEKLLEANIAVWVLRWKKQSMFDQKMFGIQDIEIVRHENPNTNEIHYIQKPAPTNVLVFVADSHGVATAYLCDTERNREVLAGHFFANIFDIVSKMTQDGVVNGVIARKEIELLAKKLNIVKPVSRDMGFLRSIANRRARIDKKVAEQRAIYDQPSAATVTPAKTPSAKADPALPTTKEEIEAAVLEQNKLLVNHLKAKKGAKWQESKEYKDIIQAEINRLVKIAKNPPAEEGEEEPTGATEDPAGSGEGQPAAGALVS